MSCAPERESHQSGIGNLRNRELTGQLRSPLQDVVNVLHHNALHVVQLAVDVVQVTARPAVHKRLLCLLDVRVCERKMDRLVVAA